MGSLTRTGLAHQRVPKSSEPPARQYQLASGADAAWGSHATTNALPLSRWRPTSVLRDAYAAEPFVHFRQVSGVNRGNGRQQPATSGRRRSHSGLWLIDAWH
jgi:hypothetical protein